MAFSFKLPRLSNEDYKFFVNTVPEKLTCSICTNVLSDPRLTECCGQHFCQKCLQSWFKKHRNKTCPHCRQNDFVHILDKPVQREINQLKVRCSHHKEGCEWVGELGDLQTHLDSKQGCGYVKVTCPNRCLLLKGPLRKNLTEHILNECYLRNYRCEHCGVVDTYKNITGKSYGPQRRNFQSHYSKCQNFPLNCPNGCSVTKMKREHMPTHREQCPLEPVQCPFQEAGCETRLVRKDLEEHLASQSQQHLLLTLRKTQSLEQECSQSKKKNTELEQKCNTLEERCKKLEQVVNEHERRLTSTSTFSPIPQWMQ